LTCPDTGFGLGELITESTLFDSPPRPFCLGAVSDIPNLPCVFPYFLESLSLTIEVVPLSFGCIAAPIPTPLNTLAGQCQDKATLVGNHCVPDLNQVCGSGTTPNGITNECDPDVTQAQHDAALAAQAEAESLRDAALAAQAEAESLRDAALAALAEAQAQRDAILTTLFEFLRVFGVI